MYVRIFCVKLIPENEPTLIESWNFSFQDGSSRVGDDGASIMSGALDAMQPKPVVYQGPQPTPLQKPFIPGATPVHLSSRFMVSLWLFNEINAWPISEDWHEYVCTQVCILPSNNFVVLVS